MGEDGSLIVDGDIVFVRVEAISYYPADPGDYGDEPVPYDLADSAWEVDGVIFDFYSDGTVIADLGSVGSYDWDGYSRVRVRLSWEPKSGEAACTDNQSCTCGSLTNSAWTTSPC